MKNLSDFPRVQLAHRPTPLEAMPNLTRTLGGPDLYVKRDDCTGLALGGNKARQLEFYFGDAVARGATTVIISGAVQSNLVRSTAAAAAKLGLRCEVQLEERVAGMGSEYRRSGNVLLDHLFGATVHSYPDGEDERGADASLQAIADRVRGEGGRPYVIPSSAAHPPLGALGYVEAADELLAQTEAADIDLDAIVLASGSATTHAGILVGLRRMGRKDVAIYGICVRRNRAAQATRVLEWATRTAELLEMDPLVEEADILTVDDYLAPGYGHPSGDTLEALELGARTEGLVLDPVYTGKVFAGLIGLIGSGVLGPGSNVVFLHTGGTPALFAYSEVLMDAIHA